MQVNQTGHHALTLQVEFEVTGCFYPATRRFPDDARLYQNIKFTQGLRLRTIHQKGIAKKHGGLPGMLTHLNTFLMMTFAGMG